MTREATEIRFGSPAAAPYLLAGWVRGGRRDTRDLPFVWSRGEASALRLPLLKARDLDLVFRCRPFREPGAQPQVVTVEVNERLVGELELGWGVREYPLQVPASYWTAGENQVVFRYAYTASMGDDAGRREPPQLAVAWYKMRIVNGYRSDGAEPRADNEGRQLLIPPGVRLDFDLEVPSDSVLDIADAVWPDLNRQGAGEMTLEITVETDDDAERIARC